VECKITLIYDCEETAIDKLGRFCDLKNRSIRSRNSHIEYSKGCYR